MGISLLRADIRADSASGRNDKYRLFSANDRSSHRDRHRRLRGLPAPRRHRSRRRVRRRQRGPRAAGLRRADRLARRRRRRHQLRRGAAEPQDRRPARHAAGGRRLARPQGRDGARRICGAGCARWRPRRGATARSAPAPSCWRRRGCSTASAWRRTGRAASAWPSASRPSTVDADSLYVVDGKVWTSAGVTTGIDMALALVEADLGAATANLIARHFVLYARRPGYQSQFSPLLQAQTRRPTRRRSPP